MRYPDYLVHFNKNHDKKTGRFTFGDGNGDGVSLDDYRTPELDKKYSELEKTGIFNLYNKPWLKPEDNAEEKWGKDVVKAVDIGIKAFGAEKMWGSEDIDKNSLRSWFLLEDQAIGFPEIAYLLVKGWSGDKVFDTLRDADKMWDKDNAFRNAYTGYPDNKNWYKLSGEAANKEPYKDIYTLNEVSHYITGNNDTIDTYIAECEEILKEMEHSNMDYSSMDYSEYLMHFNKNHDKKSGRFSFGDGDGDGIRDDHSNQSKKQSTSDGSKKTIMISSPKNPHNPFSGREKTKIEVSDDAYKEFMKADTKHDIIRGTSNLVTGGLYLAAGVLTENPIALGVGVAALVSSAANYVDSGTHFVNKIVDSVYKDKPVGEIESLIKVDPSLFGNKKYYDPKTKEIVELSYKEAYERNKAVGYK